MKLFVTDYDNTLFIDEINIKKNIEKLNELKSNGYYIVISTGRSIPSIKEKIDLYNIPFDYLSCADGSIIYDNHYNTIKLYALDNNIIQEIVRVKKNLICDEIQISYEQGYNNILNLTKPITGFNFVIHENNIKKNTIDTFNDIKTKFPNYNYVIYTHLPYTYYCIKAKNVNKAYGINFLSEYLNIDKKDIFVIGDSDNDIEMLQEFNGVCVKNSTDEVQKICKKSYNQVFEYINEILK